MTMTKPVPAQRIAVVTTFPNHAWDVYAKQMLQSFSDNWPLDVSLLVQLDDDMLAMDAARVLAREGRDDAIAPMLEKPHSDFITRNEGRDDPLHYRKQAVRFCHKVFALHRAAQSMVYERMHGGPGVRYLIWMDADVITTQAVTHEALTECLPAEGDAVAYLGRADWDHSECGWLAFDLDHGGLAVIEHLHAQYVTDRVFELEQWHDSFVFDELFRQNPAWKRTNLTPHAKGRDVWAQSPMAAWSVHHKGPQAKQALYQEKKPQEREQLRPLNVPQGGLQIRTQNAIPHEQICAHVKQNQELIRHWLRPCAPTNEEIVVASAGPMMIAEDIRPFAAKGIKVVAVKHALTPLKKACITPWACILLDPRPHVADFVSDADPNILWFVASQVNPEVTKQLLLRGCTIWGYHAAVGAGEDTLTAAQPQAVISGGSATATRGLHLLHHLGFSHFHLFGYDLCYPDKPDLHALDDRGQPKYLELSVGMSDPVYNVKRMFYTEPQFIAQYEEINDMLKAKVFTLKAYGDGVVPFVIRAQEVAHLRRKEIRDKIIGANPPSYKDLLHGPDASARSTPPWELPVGDGAIHGRSDCDYWFRGDPRRTS